MERRKVIITDDVHEDLKTGLKHRGWSVDYNPDISPLQLKEIISEYTGMVINSKIIADAGLLECATNLKWIGRLGSGMEIIDQAYALEKGIQLINTPEANCNAVAEHALGMIISLLRNITIADQEVRDKIWLREKNRGLELKYRTIGIIGYGHTGQRFEELLRGFGAKVLVYDKYKQLSDQPGRYSAVPDLKGIKESADLISLHIPLSPETKYLIDKDFIGSCRNNFYLINTSRGPVVNTSDLLEGLKTGKVKGACLDVFENERPLTFNSEEGRIYEELYHMKQVVLSPHIAGWTYESLQLIAQVMLEKLDRCTIIN
jgi:D-3-phosphoglycerate dehydrogenase